MTFETVPAYLGMLRDSTGGHMVPLLVTGAIVPLAAVRLLASGVRRYVPRSAPSVRAAGPLLH